LGGGRGEQQNIRRRNKFQKFTLVIIYSITHKQREIFQTADYLLAVFFYGLFRDTNPTENLVNKVKRRMEYNNIDVSQVVQAPSEHCVELKPPVGCSD